MTPLKQELARLMTHAHLGPEYLRLIEALEVAVINLEFYVEAGDNEIVTEFEDGSWENDDGKQAKKALAKIEQLICGGV